MNQCSILLYLNKVLKIILLVLFIAGILISAGLFITTKNSKNPSLVNTNTNSKNIISKLNVSGNLIVNEEGKPIRLRGVNFEDPFMLEKGARDTGVVDNHFSKIAEDFTRVKALGVNVVRLPVYPGYYF